MTPEKNKLRVQTLQYFNSNCFNFNKFEFRIILDGGEISKKQVKIVDIREFTTVLQKISNIVPVYS